MNIIKDLLKLKKLQPLNTIVYLLPFLFLLGKNTILDLIIIAYCIIFCLCITIDNLFIVFIFMSFFEDVSIVPIIGGSISRVIMTLLFIKLLLYLLKHKYSISKKSIFIVLFFTISCIAGFVYNGIDFGEISVFVNVITILMYGDYFKFKKQSYEYIEEDLMKMLVYAVLIAIIHGFLNFAFLTEITGNLTTLRFKGTYEPNFMSLFINIGVIILLFDSKHFFERKEKYLLLLVFITALFMTISMTGFIGLGFILIYFVFNNYWRIIKVNIFKYKKALSICMVTLLVSMGCFLIFLELQSGNETSGKKPAQEQTNSRLIFMYETLKKGDFNTFTSGRLSIMQDFGNAAINRPLHEIIAGNGPSSKVVYSTFFKRDKYAHNSYMDIVYSFGFVGGVICFLYVFYIIKNKVFLNHKLSKDNAFYIMRYLILIYALTLSLYSKRLILFMFLL